jgi:hypothetical protein
MADHSIKCGRLSDESAPTAARTALSAYRQDLDSGFLAFQMGDVKSGRILMYMKPQRQKRTGGSNPFRSSNESLLAMGHVWRHGFVMAIIGCNGSSLGLVI